MQILSASNKNIPSMIQQGRFREDLYYRLKVIDIEIPPLRERKEDIPLLCQHFIRKFAGELNKKISGLSDKALGLLLAHSWPGNVRELENALQRAITLSQYEVILPEDLPISLSQKGQEDLLEKGVQARYSLEHFEKEYIIRILSEVGGNKTKAAEILGLDRKTISRKLQEKE